MPYRGNQFQEGEEERNSRGDSAAFFSKGGRKVAHAEGGKNWLIGQAGSGGGRGGCILARAALPRG